MFLRKRDHYKLGKVMICHELLGYPISKQRQAPQWVGSMGSRWCIQVWGFLPSEIVWKDMVAKWREIYRNTQHL